MSSQIVKITENKERLRNCHRLEEIKETWWINAMWYSGLIDRTEYFKKDNSGGKNGKIK